MGGAIPNTTLSKRKGWQLCLSVCHSPVDGGGSAVARQQGGVVDDGLVAGQVDDLVGDELGAEGQDVEVDVQRPVLLEHLRHGHLLHLPPLVLEHRHVLRHRRLGWGSVVSTLYYTL